MPILVAHSDRSHHIMIVDQLRFLQSLCLETFGKYPTLHRLVIDMAVSLLMAFVEHYNNETVAQYLQRMEEDFRNGRQHDPEKLVVQHCRNHQHRACKKKVITDPDYEGRIPQEQMASVVVGMLDVYRMVFTPAELDAAEAFVKTVMLRDKFDLPQNNRTHYFPDLVCKTGHIAIKVIQRSDHTAKVV